jgi:hypothetical protein
VIVTGDRLQTNQRGFVVHQRVLAAAAALSLLAIGIAGVSTRADAATPAGSRHSSGLAVLPARGNTIAAPSPQASRQSLFDAVQLANSAPADFSYPWIDASGAVVLDTATTRGANLFSAWRRTMPALGAPLRQRAVKVSMARMEQIRGDIIATMKAAPPGQRYITKIIPDNPDNRLILSVTKLDDQLLNGLAHRFGTDVVAVRYEPDAVLPSNQGREDDTSNGGGFYGGSDINGCTSGFSWYSGSVNFMVTAGHCYPYGGTASTPVEPMGTVFQDLRENYNVGTGTVVMTNQSVQYGDMALVQVTTGKLVSAHVYSNLGENTNSTRQVKEMWFTPVAAGDQFCTDGRITGERCGWTVMYDHYDQQLANGEWSRHTNEAVKQGYCTKPGDSGGPVYTIRSDGGVAAKGIHTWGGGGGGDYYGGPFDPCYEGFTDILDPYFGFPGVLKVM